MDKVQAYRERRMRRLLERFDGEEREVGLNKVDAYRERRRKRLAARGKAGIQSENSEKRLTEGSEYGIIQSSAKTTRKDGEPAFNRAVIAKAIDAGIPKESPTPREAIDYLKENHISTNEAVQDWTDKWISKETVKSKKKTDQEKREKENQKYGSRKKKKKAVAEKEKEARKKERQENAEARLVQNVGTRSRPASLGANPDCKPFDPENLDNHWNGGNGMHSHKEEALKLGLKDKHEYGAFALALITCPCKKDAGSFRKSDGETIQFNIDGFIRSDKSIVRYDNTTGWIAIGNPDKGITSCYPASREYFDNEKRERWDRNYHF